MSKHLLAFDRLYRTIIVFTVLSLVQNYNKETKFVARFTADEFCTYCPELIAQLLKDLKETGASISECILYHTFAVSPLV